MITTMPSLPPTDDSSPKSAQHASAPWVVKRIMLANTLRKAALANKKQMITTSITAYDLTDKKFIYGHDIDVAHFAASTQKIPIIELVLQDLRTGRLSLDTPLTWSPTDRRDGAGIYDAVGSATSGTVRDVMVDLLKRSGNTAVRVLVNKVLGGAHATNGRLADYPQLKVTRLQPIDDDRFFVGYTTAREASLIFNEFYRHTDESTTVAKEALATNIFNDYGPRSQIQDKHKLTVIDKQGMLNDPEGNNRHDIGVVQNKQSGRHVLYALFTTSPGESGESLIAPAEESLKSMGRALLHYSGDTPVSKQPSTEQRKLQTAPPETRILY